jgi:phosphate-selective porin OprO/OprP
MTFMERALPNAFSPERNTGVRAAGAGRKDRLTWSAGLFAETDGFGDNDDIDGGANLTGRITGLPFWQDDGARALHLGLSATRKAATGDSLRFSQRPEAHLASTYVDTGAMAADSALILDAEVAWVHEIFSLQGEFISAEVDAPAAGDPSFSGAYLQASVFLTGEHRPYKRSEGAFDRVQPAQNFSKGGAAGAWELAARYSTLDLTDAAIAGGELKDLTLGVNWYLNPNTRFMLNYVRADLSNRGGIADNDDFSAIMLRFQVDF